MIMRLVMKLMMMMMEVSTPLRNISITKKSTFSPDDDDDDDLFSHTYLQKNIQFLGIPQPQPQPQLLLSAIVGQAHQFLNCLGLYFLYIVNFIGCVKQIILYTS